MNKFGIALGAIILVGVLIGSWEPTAPNPNEDCNDSVMAYIMSQRFVEQRLRSPSTAEFPWASADGVDARPLGNCRHSISAYVDAENGFGAMIRSHYTATVRHTGGGRWSLESIQIYD